MRKVLIIAGLVLLTSCATERVVYIEPATTTEAVESPATNPRVSQTERERNFLQFVEDSHGDLTGLVPEILAAGWRTCENADWGWTAQDFADDLAAVATTEESMRLLAAVIAGALNFLCPEHALLLEGLSA